MKKPTPTVLSLLSHLSPTRFPRMLGPVALTLAVLACAPMTLSAGSATWSLTPATGDWNTPENWVEMTVPNGPNDTATFDLSSTTAISLSVSSEVNGLVFNPGASAFTITSGTPLIL